MTPSSFPRPRLLCLAVLAMLSSLASASAATLRIVNYNIAADVNGQTTPLPGLDTVIEAIGEQNVNGVAQPPDVVALEETTSDAVTVAPLLASLNAYYGAAVYAATGFQATETGNDPGTGNGPNSLIYNTRTLVLLGAAGVGTPQGAANGEYRQIARYAFQPVGGTAANAFYVYVSHMKSSYGGSSTVQAARALEAQILRADAAALPAGACILYTGDFNLDGSTEAAYQTITAAGAGQGIDPLNNNPPDDTQSWDTAAFASIATESATDLRYRDDIQFMSANVFNGTASGGLQYIAGSYRAFGNNGTTAFGGSVDTPANTALANLQGPITAAAALAALTTASDHLPVVADYVVTLVVPPPPGTPLPLPPPVINSATSLAGQVGVALSYQIMATNTPTGYTATGPLDGLAFDPATGIISGTPTAPGTFPVTLGAVNAGGTGTATLTLTIAAALPVVSVTALVPTTEADGGAPGVFLLTRTGDTSAPLMVTLAFKGSAKNGIDYRALKLTWKIRPGKSVQRINVVPIDRGGATSGVRVVKLVLPSGSAAYTVGNPSQARVQILYGK